MEEGLTLSKYLVFRLVWTPWFTGSRCYKSKNNPLWLKKHALRASDWTILWLFVLRNATINGIYLTYSLIWTCSVRQDAILCFLWPFYIYVSSVNSCLAKRAKHLCSLSTVSVLTCWLSFLQRHSRWSAKSACPSLIFLQCHCLCNTILPVSDRHQIDWWFCLYNFFSCDIQN